MDRVPEASAWIEEAVIALTDLSIALANASAS